MEWSWKPKSEHKDLNLMFPCLAMMQTVEANFFFKVLRLYESKLEI